MRNTMSSAGLLIMFFTLQACGTPIKNAVTTTYSISGNCDMCRNTIETAAFKKGEAEAVWSETTKTAEVTFDTTKTSAEDILRRIAYAGYDNEQFLAPDDAYTKLPECCRYERRKEVVKTPEIKEETATTAEGTNLYTCPMHAEVQSDKPGKCPKCGMALVERAKTEGNTPASTAGSQLSQPDKNVLSKVYEAYFSIKDALIKDDGKAASQKAKDFITAIESAPMNEMKSEQHTVWMKLLNDLKFDATHILENKDVEHQRGHFASLSKNMYEVVKVFKADEAIYYQHCPMYSDNKGANWLSRESGIKNPYYGSQMLTCGKTVETIK